MICLHCDRPGVGRNMCQTHYSRWRRNGDPLLKRRNRGLLDVPAVPSLGPVQTRILLTFVKNPGVTFRSYQLHKSPRALERVLKGIRQTYGQDTISTVIRRGYRMEPRIAARVAEGLTRGGTR